MLSLLSELHFWTTNDNVDIKAGDNGAFKYYLKKDTADSLLALSKKSYLEQRSISWIPPNKRPGKVKDRLQDLEEYLTQNKVVTAKWDENKLQLLLSKGILVSIVTNKCNGDLKSISFNKQLSTKLQSEIAVNGIINEQQTICTTSDLRVLGIGAPWKEPWTLEAGSRRYLSLYHEHLVVWGKTISDHPQPWCPLRRDHEKANLHLYWVGARGPEMLAYKKTDGEPISVTVSRIRSKELLVVEQKVTQRGSVSIDVNCLELVQGGLKRVAVTSVPLQTQVNFCKLSGDEIRLLLSCIDGTVAVLNRNRGSTITVKAGFIPKFGDWHTGGACLVVSNEKGQLQYFDSALNSVSTQIIGEDTSPIVLTDLSCYFNKQITLENVFWGTKDMLVVVENGPLVVVTHLENSLSFPCLSASYLTSGKVEKAINLLLSWEFNEQSLLVLQKICVQLMKEPLTDETAKFLEDALGCYHNSPTPISVEMRHKFGSQVNALTRRFFHQLVRSQMYETAFLLAVDLGHHDLFMDLHFVALNLGDEEMATAARAQASALLSRCSSEGSLCSRSSCSQCCESGSSCTEEEEEEIPQINQQNPEVIYPPASSTNCMTTNFNNPDPKPYKPTPPTDLQKTLPKASYVKPPTVPLLSVKYSKPIPTPPLPFASSLNNPPFNPPPLNSFNTNPIRSFQNNYSTSAFSPIKTNFNRPVTSNPLPLQPSNVPRIPFGPLKHTVPPPLPTTPITPTTQQPATNINRKQQAKVKFSDTVTAFIVPEVKRPVRPTPPPHLTNPQKELADSLPLCHPNEDYLKDFAPVRKSEPNESKGQPKIKVVHFGVV